MFPLNHSHKLLSYEMQDRAIETWFVDIEQVSKAYTAPVYLG